MISELHIILPNNKGRGGKGAKIEIRAGACVAGDGACFCSLGIDVLEQSSMSSLLAITLLCQITIEDVKSLTIQI